MEAMKDLRAFILIMVILAFVWLFYRRTVAAIIKKRLVFKQAPAKSNPKNERTNRRNSWNKKFFL